MGYGISILNEDDFVQIDGESQNYYMVESGTFSIPSGGGLSLPSYDLAKDIILISPPADKYFGIIAFNATEKMYLQNSAAQFVAGSVEFRRYRFDSSDFIQTSDYGLAVYDESGKTVYHSDFEPLNVVASIASAYSPQSAGISTRTFTLPDSGNRRWCELRNFITWSSDYEASTDTRGPVGTFFTFPTPTTLKFLSTGADPASGAGYFAGRMPFKLIYVFETLT